MKTNVLLLIMLVGLSIHVSTAPVNAAAPVPRATATIEAYHICEENALPAPTPSATAQGTPTPVVHFWFFFDSGCYGCLKVYNSLLPRIMAEYKPEQVSVHVQDLVRVDSTVKRALEQQYGIVKGEATEIFIGEYALLGSQEIETRLPQLIDRYLAQGGVALVQPNVTVLPTATQTSTRLPSPIPTASRGTTAQTPAVRAILFWSQTCPHCHDVIDNLLPPLQQKYGSRFELWMFEISDPVNQQLFQAALDAFRVPLDQRGVPFMIVGDKILIGSVEIPQQLPGLIEKYLAAGGVDWPRIPGLEKMIGASVPATPVALSKPVVRAVMFWMDGCPHCEEVMTRVLPFLQQKYGDQLEIRFVEVVSTQDVDNLYKLGASFGLAKEQMGVPFLIMGNRALVGSTQIPAELPGLIDQLLAVGGTDFPNIAGLNPERTPSASTSPICAPTTTDCGTTNAELPVQTILRQDPAGFALAMIVLLGMVGALVRVGLDVVKRQQRANSMLPAWRTWVVPLLVVLGLGVAGYLAYVEMFQVSAICGPIGHCNTVQTSPYARLFGILPIGVLGVLGYLAILGAWFIGTIGHTKYASWAQCSVCICRDWRALLALSHFS